jgi:hypothetical protein
MWDQTTIPHRTGVLVWLISMPFLVIQGLRNQAASRWFAMANLAGLGIMVLSERDRAWQCSTEAELGVQGVWILTAGFMAAHDAVAHCRRSGPDIT